MTSLTRSEPRVVVVTGATGGLGRSFARHYASQGMTVVLVARNTSALDTQAAQLRAQYGVEAIPMAADLTTPDGLDNVARYCAEHRVDFLINNAGIAFTQAFADLPASALREEIMLDFHAQIMLTHAALPQMLTRHSGSVVLVASLAGLIPADGDAGYVASKAGLIGFATSLNLRYRRDGVSVVAVCPGFVRTNIYQASGARDPELPPWMWSTPQRTVELSARHLSRGRKRIVIPVLRDRLLLTGWRLLPAALQGAIAHALYADTTSRAAPTNGCT